MIAEANGLPILLGAIHHLPLDVGCVPHRPIMWIYCHKLVWAHTDRKSGAAFVAGEHSPSRPCPGRSAWSVAKSSGLCPCGSGWSVAKSRLFSRAGGLGDRGADGGRHGHSGDLREEMRTRRFARGDTGMRVGAARWAMEDRKALRVSERWWVADLALTCAGRGRARLRVHLSVR
jgi:hypothetical protein